MLSLSVVPLICVAVILACSYTTSAQNASPGSVPELEQNLQRIRALLAAGNEQYQVLLELGITLQQLNHLKPDGGSRIPEAEWAYRCAVVVMLDVECWSNPQAVLYGLHADLASLHVRMCACSCSQLDGLAISTP